MLKGIFGSRPANKMDVFLAAGAAVMALVGLANTIQEYKSAEAEKENEK
jgi:hypothetical protein